MSETPRLKDKFRVAYFDGKENICIIDIWAETIADVRRQVESMKDFTSIVWIRFVI
jgi:hypothetical protein